MALVDKVIKSGCNHNFPTSDVHSYMVAVKICFPYGPFLCKSWLNCFCTKYDWSFFLHNIMDMNDENFLSYWIRLNVLWIRSQRNTYQISFPRWQMFALMRIRHSSAQRTLWSGAVSFSSGSGANQFVRWRHLRGYLFTRCRNHGFCLLCLKKGTFCSIHMGLFLR